MTLTTHIGKVLITGTSGHIGSALAQALQRRYQVIGIDRYAGPYTSHCLDILDKKNVTHLAKNVDAIVHTAALHAPHVGIHSDEQFWSTNVEGTKNLLDIALQLEVKRFVFTSTTSVYGDAMFSPNHAVWVTEELSPQPRDIYDETKLAAESLCKKASSNGLPCISLRMSRCFPEPENLMAIYRLYRGVDIRDVVLGHELALTSDLQGFEYRGQYRGHIGVNIGVRPDNMTKENSSAVSSAILTQGSMVNRLILF